MGISASSGNRSTPARQANIVATGNYNFFNLLTIALCVPLLDDACLPARATAWLLPADTPNSQAPGARPTPAAALRQHLRELKPREVPPAAACAAPGEPAAGGPGGPEGVAGHPAGGALPLPMWRRGAWLLGLLAGLAPVVYASVRMVRRRSRRARACQRNRVSLCCHCPLRSASHFMCVLSWLVCIWHGSHSPCHRAHQQCCTGSRSTSAHEARTPQLDAEVCLAQFALVPDETEASGRRLQLGITPDQFQAWLAAWLPWITGAVTYACVLGCGS